MQPVNEEIAAVLRTALRSPKVYAWMELPLITDASLGTAIYNKLGSQIILDKIISCTTQQYLEAGMDTCNLVLSNQDGSMSPLNANSPLARYFFPGPVDNKIAIYCGVRDDNGVETIAPAGIYLNSSTNQQSTAEGNEMTIVGMDQFMMFQASVYASFPPILYGNQASNYYNPNYALTNPSGDLMTWVCDAVNWMTQSTDAPVYASDFLAVSVYVGTVEAPSGIPTTLPCTIDYVHGTVTFDSPLASGSVVSVDAVPLAMAPELMIKHLFCDFGNFDPSFLKIDCSGMLLPLMQTGHEQSILQTAADIATATSQKGIQWRIWFDELGYLNFAELNVDSKPVAVLRDEYDVLSFSPEYVATNITNVVRAIATSINNQPITVVSYDQTSINVFTQYPTYDIPTNFLTTITGMDPGTAVTFLTGITSAQLFDNSYPTMQTEIEVLYNPLYQTGDIITVIEQKTGVALDFFINQITKDFQGPDVKQTLRIQQFKKTQDYAFGIGAYFGSPNPTSGSNANQGETNLINEVVINGTTVVTGGQPVTDGAFNPVVASWDGGSLPIVIATATPPSGAQFALWRWIYLSEDAYVDTGTEYLLATGNGQACGLYPDNPEGPVPEQVADLTGDFYRMLGHCTLPYDFRANNDTAATRRYFWPLIRCSDWVSTDGTLIAGGTLSSTWSGGIKVASPIQLYGNVRVGLSDYYGTTTSGYNGIAIFAEGTPGSNAIGATSTSKYGVDFGVPITGKTMFYGIQRKITPAFLCILIASTAGSFQFKRIPFSLNL
jgi:hypothetical protein